MKILFRLFLPLFIAFFSTSHAKPICDQIKEVRANKSAYNQSKYELVLYYKPACPYCVKVIRYLQSIGKQIPMKNTQDSKNQSELLKIGGKKQVPCLVIDGKALYESDAIISWLKEHRNEI